MSFQYAGTQYDSARDAAKAAVRAFWSAGGWNKVADLAEELAGYDLPELEQEIVDSGWDIPYLEDCGMTLQEVIGVALTEVQGEATDRDEEDGGRWEVERRVQSPSLPSRWVPVEGSARNSWIEADAAREELEERFGADNLRIRRTI